MSTANAFALLKDDVVDQKIPAAAAKKKAPKRKAPQSTAPAKKPTDVKPPKEVRGSEVPKDTLDKKRPGRVPGRKLEIQRAPAGNRPPKREFDRHDGTGRAHEGPKKQGAGRGNWGKVVDAQEGEAAEKKPEERRERRERREPREPRERRERRERPAKTEEKPAEPELTEEEKALIELRNKQRTVEQYQEEQKGVKVILQSRAPVDVACSVDEKNFAPLERVDLVKEEEAKIAAEKPQVEKAAKKTKKAKKVEHANIQIQFNEGRREHRKEEAKPKETKISTADETQFPSL